MTLHCQGHGAGPARSSGAVAAIASVRQWVDDVLAVLDAVPPADALWVLVGSSLGGWLALHAALARPSSAQALLLVAPAVDASRRWAAAAAAAAAGLEEAPPEFVTVPSAYVPEGGITLRRALVDDANERWLLLEGGGPGRLRAVRCPVRILHGDRDDVVPLEGARRLEGALPLGALEVVGGGDHRLSRPGDLLRLEEALGRLVLGAGG